MLQPLGATSLESATASTLWLPELPDSPLDKAIRLLQVAAEVEHALMVQYLYAGNAFTTANQMIRDGSKSIASHQATTSFESSGFWPSSH